jgi:hypothetical protein
MDASPAAKKRNIDIFLRPKYIFCEITKVNGPQTHKTTLILLFVNEPLCIARKDKNIRNIPYIGCLRHFVYFECFFVSYTIRKWPKFREIIRNFSMQIYTKFCGILRNSVTCYANFFNNSAQTTFSTYSRETSRR